MRARTTRLPHVKRNWVRQSIASTYNAANTASAPTRVRPISIKELIKMTEAAAEMSK